MTVPRHRLRLLRQERNERTDQPHTTRTKLRRPYEVPISAVAFGVVTRGADSSTDHRRAGRSATYPPSRPVHRDRSRHFAWRQFQPAILYEPVWSGEWLVEPTGRQSARNPLAGRAEGRHRRARTRGAEKHRVWRQRTIPGRR